MKNPKYVILSGCSFCEYDEKYYSKESQNMGVLFSSEVGAQLINLSESGASIDFIVTKTLEWIKKNPKKISSTLFLIGLPARNRLMFWQNNPLESHNGYQNCHHIHFYDGNDRNLSNAIYKWPAEQQILYARNFLNTYVIRERYNDLVLLLQNFFSNQKLEHLFFNTSISKESLTTNHMDYVNEGPVDFSGDETPLHEVENFHDSVPHLDKKFFYTDSKYFSMVDSVRNNSEFVCPDGYHTNEKGQEYWAKALLKYYKLNFNV
jgi:hypothetical protein